MKKQSKKENKKVFLIYSIIVGIIVFAISLYRTRFTGITYDEAWTYLNYVNGSNPFSTLSYLINGGVLANNHILNTLFISIVEWIFKKEYVELLIRIPSLISYVLYLVFSYKLSNKYKNKFLIFNLLVFNYGVHEFFGLARGYGMATSFVLVGIYFLKKYEDNIDELKWLSLSYVFMCLACYANTVSLMVFASVLIYTFIQLCINKKIFEYIKKQWMFYPIIAALTIVIIRYHFLVTAEGNPVFGKEGINLGIISDLLNTFGFNSISSIAAIIVGILLIVCVILLRNKIINFKAYYLPIILILLNIIATIVTGKPSMTDRLLIPSTPLIVYGLMELLELFDSKKAKYIFIGISIIPIIVFACNLNLKETRDWKDNYIVKDYCYEALEKQDYSIIPEDQRLYPYTDFYVRKIKDRTGEDISTFK